MGGRLDPEGHTVQLLYIMGLGRSGSTVLDSLLGNHPRMIGVGELRLLPTAGWKRSEYCACGVVVDECPFWREVRRRWEGLTDGATPSSLEAAQNRVERIRYRGFGGRGATTAHAEYARSTGALLRALEQVSGADIIVDSSKHPGRASALARIEGVTLRAVHLVRDVRAVAWSLSKAYDANPRAGLQRKIVPRPPLRTALRWVFVNGMAERVARRLGPERWCRVRYEDLARDPARALGDIGRLCGIDLGPLGERAASGEELRIGHTVAGNRLRMKGSFRLRFDEQWQGLSTRDERLLRLVAGPFLRRYGYMS